MRAGKPVEISYIHAGTRSDATIIPASAVLPNAAGQPALGIALVFISVEPRSWSESFVGAFHQTGNAFGMVVRDFGGLVAGAFRGAFDISAVTGPVGIVSYVSTASQNGPGAVFSFAALISINLVIINLIPIPALDGGRLFLLGVEGVARRSVPRLVVRVLNALGVGLIILLMFVVTYNDIARLFM
jgi:regulator of sigma E protease